MPGEVSGQGSDLTPEQQRLLKEANALHAVAVQLSQQAKLTEAADHFQKILDLLVLTYPKPKYPQGHPDLIQCRNELGTLLRTQREYAKAESVYREAIDMSRELFSKTRYPHGHVVFASSLSNLSVLYVYQHEYAKAEPWAQEALEMRRALFPKDKYPQGHPQIAHSLTNLGGLYQMQADYAKAEAFYDEALEMYRSLYPKAQHSQGHLQLAHTLNNLGTLFKIQREYAKAKMFYQEAVAMYRAIYPKAQFPHGHPQLAVGLTNLADLSRTEQEYPKAEASYREALEIYRAIYPKGKYPQGHPDLANSLNALGFLLCSQGEYAKAEPLVYEALGMTKALYPKSKYARGHAALAFSLSIVGAWFQDQQQYAKAEPYVRQALQMNEALYPKAEYAQGHPHLTASLQNLGILLLELGEDAKAEPLLRDALEMNQALYPKAKYPRGHSDLAHSLNNLGALFRSQGQYAKAETVWREALAMTRMLYPKTQYPQGHPQLAHSLNNLGGLFHERGEHAQAEPFYREALDLYTQLANRLAQIAPEPVALNAAVTFPMARDGLLSATKHMSGWDTRTYDAIWHSRAALTRVYQRRHLAVSAAAVDDSVRKGWDDLQVLRRQREQLIMAPLPKSSDHRRDTLQKLNQEIDTVEQSVLHQLPAVKHYEDLAKLGPDALRKLLPANAVLIDFLRYTHFEQDPRKPGDKGEKRTVRYLAFVVSRQDVQRVELGTAAETDLPVRQWRETITAKPPVGNEAARKAQEANLARQGAALRRLLWQPIEKCLPPGTVTVYVAPDGELTQLPWTALPGKRTDCVLLDDYALAVLPHGPFLLEQLVPAPPRAAKRAPFPNGLLLAGGIDYDCKPIASVVASGEPDNVVKQKVVWDYLKGTDDERRLLATLLQKTGPKVTANLNGAGVPTVRLRQELERCRYAHVATHGFFADAKFRSVLQLDPKLFDRIEFTEGVIGQRMGAGARSPLVLSGLVCAGANLPETPERGILSADAIAGLLLDDLHIAVLSACDTGIGDVAGGEGVFGLQRAFHIAGCKNVVASLWKVDDAATAALMTRFYGHLFAEDAANRLPPIEALRRAQLELYRHPELIPTWAKGEQRSPGKPRPATIPAPAETPPELLTSEGRAPIRLWAAFTLSGRGS
jgi:CHAT domain-containing protein/Tfp pilus assembly protein PilF